MDTLHWCLLIISYKEKKSFFKDLYHELNYSTTVGEEYKIPDIHSN